MADGLGGKAMAVVRVRCAISLPDPVTVTMPPIVAIITCSAHATVRGMDSTRIRLIIA
jgi:hypothetical protein